MLLGKTLLDKKLYKNLKIFALIDICFSFFSIVLLKLPFQLEIALLILLGVGIGAYLIIRVTLAMLDSYESIARIWRERDPPSKSASRPSGAGV
jgi:hypothetical protein